MKALVILFLLCFFSIFEIWNVEGKGMKMKCCKFEMRNFGLRCYKCDEGTRCMYCTYLLAFHLGNWFLIPDPIPFKEPFIGMFDDIKEKLESDSQYFLKETILRFFQETLAGLKEDCKHCRDYTETRNFYEHIEQASSRLGAIVGTSTSAFVTAALGEINKTLELLEKIPKKLSVPRPSTSPPATVPGECENKDSIGKPEWKPIIDCRDSLNLAVTPPDTSNKDWRTSKLDPNNDNQLWRQDAAGRIINKANGKAFKWDQFGPGFQEVHSSFRWRFNTCLRSSQEPSGSISQKLQAITNSENRYCLNTANRFTSTGSALMLYPCESIHPVNGCFKFK